MNTIQLVGQAITSTNCTTPRLFNFNPAPVREAADVFLASGVNEIEVPEGVLDPEGRDIWSNKAEVGERLTGVPGVRIQARGKQASPQGYYALVFVFDEAPLADVPGDRLRAADRGRLWPRLPAYVVQYGFLHVPDRGRRVCRGGMRRYGTGGRAGPSVAICG